MESLIELIEAFYGPSNNEITLEGICDGLIEIRNIEKMEEIIFEKNEDFWSINENYLLFFPRSSNDEQIGIGFLISLIQFSLIDIAILEKSLFCGLLQALSSPKTKHLTQLRNDVEKEITSKPFSADTLLEIESILRKWQENKPKEKIEPEIEHQKEEKIFEDISEMSLGRRLLYSHHIRAPAKIEAIESWAEELDLGGVYKAGQPGIILVEGEEGNCKEYVRRLQHLRWRYFVCRGEQILKFKKKSDFEKNKIFNKLIRVNEIKDISELCKKFDIHDLFLTALKIYH